MNENLKQWSYLTLLTFFIIVIISTIISFQYVGEKEIPSFLKIFLKYHIFFMFFIAIFGVIFGSITQLMTSKKIEMNKEKVKLMKNYFLNSLPVQEKKVIEYLIKNKGMSTQYELTKIDGMNKLKISRMLIDMEIRHVIEKKKIGKINKIFLKEDIIKIFE